MLHISLIHAIFYYELTMYVKSVKLSPLMCNTIYSSVSDIWL